MKKKILLVEYATASIDFIKEILSHPIFEITVVNEGDTAKEKLMHDSFDLMITAAMLPKFHGFNLSQYAAETFPNMRIIIISEIYKGMDYKHQATTIYQADDFFEKPLNKIDFKKRVFELLELDEEMLKRQPRITTTQVPISDTKKIPTLQKLEEEGKKLSSADLFGDIIEKVQDLPSYEINLDSEGGKKGKVPGMGVPPFTQKLTPPVTQKIDAQKVPSSPGAGVTQKIDTQKIAVPPKHPPVTQLLEPGEINQTQKIDQELLDLIKAGRKERELAKKKVPEEKFKKIEEDISKKLEDTLSGLGLSSKPSSAAAPVSHPAAPAAAAPPPPPPPPAKPAPPKAAAPPPAKEKAPAAPVTEPVKPFKPPEIKPPEIKPQEIKPPEIEQTDEVGGYEILGLIGRGGMAEIYKAKKKGVKGFEKVIALKKILSGYGTDAKYIEMFVDEAKIAAELSHPNIVQIYDLGKKDDYYFIAMEYVLGKDLRVILQKITRLGLTMPEELAIYLVIKVLEALNYAHAARDSKGKSLDIVHRDVSPPNIIVSYEGNIKLTDFGVSKASIKMHQTLAGALKGKLLYMSPEQAKGEDNIDSRADLYSAAIILFELITGEKLFLGTSEIGTLKKVQEGKIIKPSLIKNDIEPELEAIILKALSHDAPMRYQKAAEFIKDLESYINNHYESMPEPSHIAHFIYNLFKDEIIKEGIKVHMGPIPYPISKKKKKEPEIPVETPGVEELPETPEEELEDVLQTLEEEVTAAEEMVEEEAEEMREDLPEEEEFQPIIEINFEEDTTKKLTPPPSFDAPRYATISPFQEPKKKTNLMLIGIIVIVVLAIAVVLFLMFGRGGSEPAAGPPPEPVSAAITTDTAGTESSGAEGTTSTEVVTSQPEIKTGDQQQPPQTTPAASDETAKTMAQTPAPKAGQEQLTGKEKGKTAEGETVSTTSPQEKPAAVAETEPAQKKIDTKTAPEEIKTPLQTPKEEKPVEETKVEPQEEAKPETKPTETTPAAQTEKPPAQAAPTLAAVKEGDVVSPAQLDTQPVLLSTPVIEISHSIRRLLTSDQRILVSYLVDHNGNVETVKVLNQSSLKRLNAAIIETISKWKFKPATKNNVRVKVWKNQWIAIKK